MSRVKQEIEERIRIAMRTSASRIVINWGAWGSGKTHAANYFTRTERLSEISEELGTSKAKSFRVNLPRTSKDVVQAFWRALLGQMNFSNIVQDIQRLKQELKQPEDFEAVISAVANDQVIKQLFIQLSEVQDDGLSDFESYLYGDTSRTILRKLNVPLGLSDDEQVVNLISTLFSCLTYKKMLYSSVFLWIDEFEDIDTLFLSKQRRFLFQVDIRESNRGHFYSFERSKRAGTVPFQANNQGFSIGMSRQ